METTFTPKEVKAAIGECDSNKAPGPDGINFFFIKKSWETIGDDIYGLVDDFYLSGLLPDGINSSFITLFPKVVGDDIYGLVDDFYLSGLLPDGINSSFIN